MDSFALIPFPADLVQESDIMLAQTLQRWAETEVIAKRLEYREDPDRLINPAVRKLFVDLEMQKIIFPEELGGIGLNKPDVAHTLALALEQVGRADTGIGYLFAITFALCSSFTMESTLKTDLCRTIAPVFCQDENSAIGSLVLPAYSSELTFETLKSFRGKTLPARARRQGQSFIINGENLRPLNSGRDAALFGILCELENEAEPGFILVPADAAGLSRGRQLIKTGLAASVNAELSLNNVCVPASNLVFCGESSLQEMLSWLYLGLSAVSVGSLFATYEIIRDWGDTRVIKGKGCPFRDNPLTASVMAEISHELLISRLLLHQLARMISNPKISRETGEEKLYIPALSIASQISCSAEKAINRTMELMGSAGYATEWNLERYWRDIKTMQLHLGSWEINKMELARFFYQSQNL
jgi:alkylation response protein AidB-like acyl-CoA dehydrogenase